MSIADASARLRHLGLSPEVVGDNSTVVRQTPAAGARLGPGGSVILYSAMIEVTDTGQVAMPDLLGKTVREAVQNLVENRLDVNIEGSGLVRRQSPAPGRLVKLGTVCVIACGR
jgi:beta-lactam-binding protein with PASTA domain